MFSLLSNKVENRKRVVCKVTHEADNGASPPMLPSHVIPMSMHRLGQRRSATGGHVLYFTPSLRVRQQGVDKGYDCSMHRYACGSLHACTTSAPADSPFHATLTHPAPTRSTSPHLTPSHPSSHPIPPRLIPLPSYPIPSSPAPHLTPSHPVPRILSSCLPTCHVRSRSILSHLISPPQPTPPHPTPPHPTPPHPVPSHPSPHAIRGSHHGCSRRTRAGGLA